MRLWLNIGNAIFHELFFAFCCTQPPVNLQWYRIMKYFSILKTKAFLDHKIHIFLRKFGILIIFEEKINVTSFPKKSIEEDTTESETRSGVTKRFKDRQPRLPGHFGVYCLLHCYVIKLTNRSINQTWYVITTFWKFIGNFIIIFIYKNFLPETNILSFLVAQPPDLLYVDQ